MVPNEIREALSDMSQPDRELHFAAIRYVMREATYGRLYPRRGVRCVSRQPIFELRWEISGRLWRLYEGEPVFEPNLLIALRFHEKDVSTNDDELIRSRQDDEIGIAEDRYGRGLPSRWGRFAG
ncbi:hypothetical protein [Leifsonia sp. SIMBA_070]|uniref:hypothetical protein n=1 Tax=Leifsonia sp. SIMBA_070 TaxID=3085810 RepID=UPI003978AB5E